MNQISFWDAISGITSLVALLITVLLEWPRLQKRWKIVTPTLMKISRFFIGSGMLGGFITMTIGILFTNTFLGQIGLWAYVFSNGTWSFFQIINNVKHKNMRIESWFFLLLVISSLFITVYAYYHTSYR